MIQRGDQLNPCSLMSRDASGEFRERISKAFRVTEWEAALDFSAETAS